MQTADYALIVGICSAVVAVASFGWNVWSKYIYPKAKLRVTFYNCTMVGGGDGHRPQFLCLDATNFGPTELTVNSIFVRISNGFGRKPTWALVNPIHDIMQPEIGVGPFGGGLPKKLAVGESFSSYFPFIAQSFARDSNDKLGFTDVFGRRHCCPRRDIATVQAALAKAFPDEPYAAAR